MSEQFCPTSNPRVFFKDGKLYVMQDLAGHQIFTPYIYGSKPPYPEPLTS
jgi:hypothetical protein